MQTTHVPFEEPTVLPENQFGTIATNAMGYATEIHSLDKNPVVSVEIPHYNLGRKNYNSSYQSTELLVKMMNSLGNLKITFMGPVTTQIHVVVYRAIGDDFLMSVFNGLPNRLAQVLVSNPYMGNTRPIPVVPANERQSETEHTGDMEWIPDLTEEGIEPEPGPFKHRGNFSLLGSDFAAGMRKIGNASDKIGSLTEAIELVVRKDERLLNYVDILLQIGHVLINPDLRTFVIALTSITLKILPVCLLKTMGSRVSAFCSNLFKSSNMEGNMEGKSNSMADDIWDCIGEFFNVRPPIRNSWMRKFNLIMKMTTMADKIVSFIESVVHAFKIFLNKMYRIYDKEGFLFKIISDSQVIDCLTGYNSLVTELTDQAVFRQITASQKNITMCFTTRRYGRIIANHLIKTRKLNPHLHQSITRSNMDMDKLCARLLAFANRPLVRRDPFCVYMFGGPGIGKSHTATKLVLGLLQSVKIPITGDPIFVKSSGTKFMDGYQEQPAFVYDDFGAVQDAEGTEFGELIALKSSNYYQGNYANVDDKQKPVHPEVLFVCSNLAMPTNNMVQTPDAFFRRRDVLVKVELSPAFKCCVECSKSPKGLGCELCFSANTALIADGSHLRFTICNSMTGGTTPTVYTGFKAFEKYLARKHAAYYAKETANMMSRLNAITEAINACEKPNIHGKLETGNTVTKAFLNEQLESHNLNIKIDDDFVNVFNTLLLTDNVALINSKVLNNKQFEQFPEIFEQAGDFTGNQQQGDAFVDFLGTAAKATLAVGSVAAVHAAHKFWKKSQIEYPDINCICTFIKALEAMHPKVKPLLEKPPAETEEEETNIVLCEVTSQLSTPLNFSSTVTGIINEQLDDQQATTSKAKRVSEEIEDFVRNDELKCENGFFKINGVRYYIECDKCIVDFDKSKLAEKYGIELDSPCLHNNEQWMNGKISVHHQSGRYVYFKDAKGSYMANKIMCDYCAQNPLNNNLLSTRLIKHGYTCMKNDQDIASMEVIKSIFFAITTVSALVYAMRILHSIYKMIFPIRGNSGDSDYEKERLRMIAKHKKDNKRAGKYMRHSGDADFDVANAYKRNLVSLQAGNWHAKALGIAGDNYLTTGHWCEEFEREGTCTIDGVKFNFSDVEVKYLQMPYDGTIKTADIVLIKFRGTPHKKNIIHHFVTEDELERGTVPKKLQYEDSRSNRTIMGLSVEQTMYDCVYEGKDRFISGYEYDFMTSGVDYEVYNGGCMSALIDHLHKQIVAFHVCSGPRKILQRYGYAQCITRETLNSLLGVESVEECENIDLNILYAEDFTVNDKLQPLLNLKPYISVQGTLDEPIRHVTYTELRPSPMFGVLTTDGKKPVVFTTIGEAYPGVVKMEQAINKNEPTVEVTPKHVTLAKNALKHKILEFEPTYAVKQVRTATESIDGVLGLEYMRPQVSRTSNAIPLREYFPMKSDTYTRKGKKLFLNSMVVDLHERNMAMRYNNKCPPTAFQVVLKDELKSEGKRDSPREVDCSPTEFTQTVRQYTLDVSSAIYENNLKQFSAVGMNCLGADWQRLTRKLRWHDYILAGDVSAFGPTLPHSLCENVWIAINHWYDHKASHDQQANQIRNVLCKESLTSVKVAYNTVFKTNASSPSGLGITTIVNTMCMWQYLYIAWCVIVEDHYKTSTIDDLDLETARSVATFEDKVDTVIYGFKTFIVILK